MLALADPVVTALLTEFTDAVDHLQHVPDVQDRLDQIKDLCELSRDARFQLGPPRFAEPEQLQQVAQCFTDGVERIRGLWPNGDVPDEVEAYCTNIVQRAQRCRT